MLGGERARHPFERLPNLQHFIEVAGRQAGDADADIRRALE